LGRFLSRDPGGIAGGVNLYAYAYAGDDPVNFSGPMGREYGFPIGGSYGFYNGVFGNNGGGGGGQFGGTGGGGVGIVGAYGVMVGDGVFTFGVFTYGVGWFGASISGIGGLGRGMGPAKPLPNLDGIYNVVLHGHNGGGLGDPKANPPGPAGSQPSFWCTPQGLVIIVVLGNGGSAALGLVVPPVGASVIAAQLALQASYTAFVSIPTALATYFGCK